MKLQLEKVETESTLRPNGFLLSASTAKWPVAAW
jgi:hypothetical protein